MRPVRQRAGEYRERGYLIPYKAYHKRHTIQGIQGIEGGEVRAASHMCTHTIVK